MFLIKTYSQLIYIINNIFKSKIHKMLNKIVSEMVRWNDKAVENCSAHFWTLLSRSQCTCYIMAILSSTCVIVGHFC